MEGLWPDDSSLLEIIDAHPIPKGGYLWTAGVGSVARGNVRARDIDIAVWLEQKDWSRFNDHLIRSFEKHGIDCTQNIVTGFFGLPVFVGKNETWSGTSGRAIELIVSTSKGINPKELIDAHSSLKRAPAVEFLRKGF